jgi:hypothetical protein
MVHAHSGIGPLGAPRMIHSGGTGENDSRKAHLPRLRARHWAVPDRRGLVVALMGCDRAAAADSSRFPIFLTLTWLELAKPGFLTA